MHVLMLAAAFGNFAATPQAAVVRVVPNGRTVPRVVRVNIAGRYAAVLTTGASMEGSPVTAPILVERFSFGWQPLDLLNFRCRLDAHGLGARVNRLLMRGMPMPKDDRPCQGVGGDSGPRGDVEAIRAMMRGPLVPRVGVSGAWAMGDWYGAGGGETLYRKRGRTWVRIAGGGGAMGVGEMRAFGVPRSAWCAFGIYDAKCAKR